MKMLDETKNERETNRFLRFFSLSISTLNGSDCRSKAMIEHVRLGFGASVCVLPPFPLLPSCLERTICYLYQQVFVFRPLPRAVLSLFRTVCAPSRSRAFDDRLTCLRRRRFPFLRSFLFVHVFMLIQAFIERKVSDRFISIHSAHCLLRLFY